MNNPKVPNSFNQGMALLWEDALVNALTPILERLDRIERYLCVEPPVTEELLTQVLEPINQQLSSQSKALDLLSGVLEELAISGEKLAEILTQQEEDRNQQLEILREVTLVEKNQLTQSLNALSQKVALQDQDLESISTSLGELAARLSELVKALQP